MVSLWRVKGACVYLSSPIDHHLKQEEWGRERSVQLGFFDTLLHRSCAVRYYRGEQRGWGQDHTETLHCISKPDVVFKCNQSICLLSVGLFVWSEIWKNNEKCLLQHQQIITPEKLKWLDEWVQHLFKSLSFTEISSSINGLVVSASPHCKALWRSNKTSQLNDVQLHE